MFWFQKAQIEAEMCSYSNEELFLGIPDVVEELGLLLGITLLYCRPCQMAPAIWIRYVPLI